MRAYKRIKALAMVADGFISEDAVVADIACDHGYLAELFDRNNKIKRVYATDISQKCLDKIEKLKKDFNLSKVETLLGDGLEPLHKINLAVIAGVGGLEIIKMLTKQNETINGERKCDIFVLQPAQNVFEFRKWLFEEEIFVISDFLVEDAKRFYPIIAIDVSKKQKNEASLFNLYCGRDNDIENLEFRHFLEFSIKNFEYLESVSHETINRDSVLFEKYQIYNMLNSIKNKT